MKKLFFTFIVLIFVSVAVAGCGTNENNVSTKNEENTNATTEETNEGAKETDETPEQTETTLKEPDENTTCAYCNMKVYTKDHDMGAFSAQAITADGKTLFFDDVGGMLNQERVDNATFEKYVRDYYTKEWVKLENAVVVKAEIKTPMNYGYAFFSKKEDANRFIEENGEAKATLSSVSDIDEVANQRHLKRMEKMENGEGMDMNEMNSEMDQDNN